MKNLIIDVEQYFKAIGTCVEDLKVTLTTTYFVDDAKIWWLSKVNDFQSGSYINSWEDIKKELMNQFFPENVKFVRG